MQHVFSVAPHKIFIRLWPICFISGAFHLDLYIRIAWIKWQTIEVFPVHTWLWHGWPLELVALATFKKTCPTFFFFVNVTFPGSTGIPLSWRGNCFSALCRPHILYILFFLIALATVTQNEMKHGCGVLTKIRLTFCDRLRCVIARVTEYILHKIKKENNIRTSSDYVTINSV